MEPETIMVKREGGKGYRIINADAFDPKVHEALDKESAAAIKAAALAKKPLADMTPEELQEYNANRGQTPSGSVIDTSKNPSGTFSEPTPTDIRYPNKRATEFENNLGAFIGKSAAGLRKEAGMPDVPGGIRGAVSIPADWRGLDRDGQLKLAGELSGNDDLSIKQSKRVIADEVRRRNEAGEPLETETEGDEGPTDEEFASLKTHKALDAHLADSDLEEPDEWADMKVDEKREWLKSNKSD